ncbi:MAG: deoxyribodipyrimidine photo-lyase [Methanophagales archaeon ANME-1-THS]|nr:MAG: deoxyribodipyrimidine photo-lyase [Methanophagales archaeon ANME-1-THS]
MVHKKRVRILKGGAQKTGPVIYWMSRDQRVRDNWALLFAQEVAVRQSAPMAVVFCLVPTFLGATMRQYGFMLRGLQEVEKSLNALNIPFFLLTGAPDDELPKVAAEYHAGALVTDFDPLSMKNEWKRGVAGTIDCPFYEVDAHNIVPCWVASPHQEYAAYTFRPKIKRALPEFLEVYPELRNHPYAWPESLIEIDWSSALKTLQVEQTVREVEWLRPGEEVADRVLHEFIDHKLALYPEQRNDPTRDGLSNLSPYLHFGQISAERVALEVQQSDAPIQSKAAFLEELIVRRELSDNFCFYNPFCASFEGLPEWAKKTLRDHEHDAREYCYSHEELEHAETHDPYWNAAQTEMVVRGKMHGYMRMYWGKKILEWSRTPEDAFNRALYLNDKYELDGRDPNGFTGIAWCFGLHDRPWRERAILGKLRYMNANGLRRKFDAETYVKQVAAYQA